MVSNKERYSFSKLSAFHTCRYGYMLTYIQHKKGNGNCFSSYGKELHSLMERYAKGELDLNCLPDVYEWEFDANIPEEFPSAPYCKNMRELYYKQGLEFLQSFPGYNGLKILEIEHSFEVDIDDWVFNGIIDLVFEDSKGNITVQDYKSKGKFKSKKECAEYARQLYLYALFVKQKYGRYPTALRFVMFRKQTVIEIPFDQNNFSEAVEWAKSTVTSIRECWDYPPNSENFYCSNLCDHRGYCDCKST